jgi:DNA-binding LacI/PurR family transcriptional regulator
VRTKAVTLKDVAERANVSIATVSRVLSNKLGDISITDETKNRVIEAAKELQYQPNRLARNLRMGRAYRHIFFVYTQSRFMDDLLPHPFFSRMLHGLQMEALQNNCFLSNFGINYQNTGALRTLMGGDINGIISWGVVDDAVYRWAAECRVPQVAIEPYARGGDTCPSVYVDNEMAIRQAVEHLVELGHRRIGIACELGKGLPQFRERFEAFQRVIREMQLPVFAGQEIVNAPDLVGLGAGTQREGEEALARWAALPQEQRPTAVVTSADLVALAVIKVFRSKGLEVPRDISVVGIDDIDWSRYNEPPLTTVRIPQEEMGKTAIQLLEQLWALRKVNEPRRTIATSLVIRETTRRI